MLKSITLNRKKIPVPIPLTSLREAIAWVESDLLTQDRTITQVTLDGEEIEFSEKPIWVKGKLKLNDNDYDHLMYILEDAVKIEN